MLEAIINETLGLVSERLKNSGIRLTLDKPTEDSLILANSIQISQVLLNIINNALDAILEEESNPVDKYIKIDILKNKNHVTIDVINNGPMIPMNVLNNIFQPFFSTKEIGKGTGLGLSSSKGIIEEHGGSLTVKSDKDLTCFIIELPLLDEESNEKSQVRLH